jgi:DNA-binding CsgD family transcriptional regulator
MPHGPGSLLAEIADRGDVAATITAVAGSLRAWVGAGPVFLATADPLDGSFTGTFTFDVPEPAAAAFFAHEMAGGDVVTFAGLAASPAGVGSLFAATEHEPRRSARWREVMAPLGWGDELRAAVRSDHTVWGYLCLHREARDRPFRPQDLARLSALLPVFAGALRRLTLTPTSPDARSPGTGVLLIDGRGRIVGRTGGAAHWLDELGGAAPGRLPLVVEGLAAEALLGGRPVSRLVMTRTGRMAVAEAAPLDGPGEPRSVVVLSAASPEQRLDRWAAAAGLSRRERDVLTQVLGGSSTRAIAAELSISVHTVQAHLTAIFDKSGVRTRRELVSRLSGP